MIERHDSDGPPTFGEARTLRHKARAAGLNPNYWYPVEWAANLKSKNVAEVVFWKQSIALYRDAHGKINALTNRCAHRQLKLSLGHVEGCNLVCSYHGWSYDGDGQVVDIPHELFGHTMPKLRVPHFPVKERYGLIWIFPGDPNMSEKHPIPEIPELEGTDSWPRVDLDFTWNAHHSMIIDNVSDFTHAHLHRKYSPFSDAKLLKHETVGDSVRLSYEAKIGRGKITGRFVDHKRINTNQMELCYDYPYQWSNTDDEIKHWLFVLPINERQTRSFFVFFFKSLKIPFLGIPLRRRALQTVLDVSKHLSIKPLLSQDGVAVEAEQDGHEAHWNTQFAELNPVIRAFQEVTVRKWQEALDQHASPKKRRSEKHQ